MFRRCIMLVVLFCSVFMSYGKADGWAYLISNKTSEGDPSVFEYGWRGMLIGVLSGLSAGYVRYSEQNNTENITKSAGYGTLAGAGIGIIMGIADVAKGRKGMGDILLRDMNLGGWFGLTVGTLYGGINTISNGDWKNVGTGASWGYLGGVTLGLIVALYEGPKIVEESSTPKSDFVPSITFLMDSQKDICPALLFAYEY